MRRHVRIKNGESVRCYYPEPGQVSVSSVSVTLRPKSRGGYVSDITGDTIVGVFQILVRVGLNRSCIDLFLVDFVMKRVVVILIIIVHSDREIPESKKATVHERQFTEMTVIDLPPARDYRTVQRPIRSSDVCYVVGICCRRDRLSPKKSRCQRQKQRQRETRPNQVISRRGVQGLRPSNIPEQSSLRFCIETV